MQGVESLVLYVSVVRIYLSSTVAKENLSLVCVCVGGGGGGVSVCVCGCVASETHS